MISHQVVVPLTPHKGVRRRRGWFQQNLTGEGRLFSRYQELVSHGLMAVAVLKKGPSFEDGRRVPLKVLKPSEFQGDKWVLSDGKENFTVDYSDIEDVYNGRVLAGYE